MQTNDMAEKRRILADGTEIPGLVNVGDIILEEGVLEVPEFSKIRKIKNGITMIPTIPLIYKTNRGTETLKFFQDWKNNNEVKDVTLIRTDAHGAEFARQLWSGCEISKITYPAYDATSPTYAQIQIDILPYDVVDLEPEA